MARKKPRPSKTGSAKKAQQSPPSKPKKKMTRRDALVWARDGALIAAGVGAVGWYVIGGMQATAYEHDLSRLGGGVPTVVQIHDPNCPQCRALQYEARRALEAFDDDQLLYLVADIRTGPGRALAAEHNVGHVTLVLFDGEGERQSVLVGERPAAELEAAFRELVTTQGQS